MIAIIGALQIEIDPLCEKMENLRERTCFGQIFYEGNLLGHPVVLTRCGIGKVNAGRTAQLLISEYQPSCIINTGVAGCVSASLLPGWVVIADKLAQHDMDTTPCGDPLGYMPCIDGVFFPSDTRLCQQLFDAAQHATNGNACMGTIVSGDQFIADSAKTRAFHEQFGAAAVDMESAAIAQVCHLCGIAFAALRTMSDKADSEGAQDFATLAQITAENSCNIILAYLHSL